MKDNKRVFYWLITGCVLIFIMVVVGGITRLTHSGLSMSNYKLIKDGKQGILRIYLKYTDDNAHVIQEINRVSKPSRRVYVGAGDVKSFYSGMGISVLSTSKGILTDKQARKEHVGGEVLCNIF